MALFILQPSALILPSYWTALPFGLLLCAIALFPLLPRIAPWWHSNLHRFYVAGGCGLAAILYYLILNQQPVEGHWPIHFVVAPASGGLQWRAAAAVAANAICAEYVPFIVLLFSLYTISGGIRIEGRFRPTPQVNTVLLALGALLASFIGTTGAAMILIRPLLEANRDRRHVRHTLVFFIFTVCNCGGCLLPLGDPPLLLGYLLGVPFLWTLTLWPQWLFANGLLLAIYYLWDRFWPFPREALPAGGTSLSGAKGVVRGPSTPFTTNAARRCPQGVPPKILGLWPNGLLLLGVIASIALLDPGRPIPGTSWRPWIYLREVLQGLLVLCSLCVGSSAVRKANKFNYHAIVEVAVLFAGIFLTVQAPLEIMRVRGPSLGLHSPAGFFWATGGLSAVLDNAPTYLVFFEAAKSLGGEHLLAGVEQSLLIAVSLGSVFMGAMTYIGNGPNFMVKSLAEESGVGMPGFFGYLVYSAAVLLPVLLLTTWIFL